MTPGILVLPAAFFSIASVYAQLPDFSASWGSKQLLYKTPYNIDVVDIDDTSVYVVTSHFKEEAKLEVPRTIERYSKINFERSDSMMLKRLKFKEQGRKCRIEQVLAIGKKLYVIYSMTDPGNKITLLARELSKTNLEPVGNSQKLCEIGIGEVSKVREGQFQFSFSKDRSKIFGFRGMSKGLVRRDFTSFVMLDTALQLLWHREAVVPYPPGALKPQDIKIANSGDVYILANQKEAGQRNNVFDILFFQNNGDSIKVYPIRFKNGYLTSLQMEILESKNLLCAGFYSKAGGAGARGTYLMEFDTSLGKLKTVRSQEFESNFILRDLNKRDMTWVQSLAERNEEAELNAFTMDKILIQKDSSLILIGEQRYKYTISTGVNYYRAPTPITQGQGTRGAAAPRSYNYSAYNSSIHRDYHGDVIAVKLDRTGRILWTQKINKSQDTSDRDVIFSSYLLAVIHGKLCVLFNDNPQNLNEDRRDKPKDFGGGKKFIVVMVTMDEVGNQIREWIYESVNTDVTVSPVMSRQVSDHDLLLFGHHWVYQQFTWVKFR